MLKEIGICPTDRTDSAPTGALLDAAVRHLKEEGFAVRILEPQETHPSEHPDALYLTDDPGIAEVLRARDAKVVGFLHERNTPCRFPGLKFVFDEIDQVEGDSFRKVWERLSGLPWTILHTKRLTVRETTLDDIDVFYRIYRDPGMTEFQEGLFQEPEDEKKYLADYITNVYGLLGFGVWTVLKSDTGEIIGRAGFSVRGGFEAIELGFLIAREHQRQGYAYEVCDAILRYGQQVLRLEQVQALVKAQNEASVRLCERLGFLRSETVRIEENIYGDRYYGGGAVSFSPARYGEYIRFVRRFDREKEA